jgi:SnoaL-like domain
MSDERLEVQQVVSRFFLEMDRFDWDAISTIVDDQITLVAGAFVNSEPAPASRDQFMEELIARNGGFSLDGSGSYHGNAGHVIDIHGDDAVVRAHMFGSHWVGPDPQDEFHSFGIYELALRRSAAGWRIRRLAIIPLRNEGAEPTSIMDRARLAWQSAIEGSHRDDGA